jgi:hypothetical protein
VKLAVFAAGIGGRREVTEEGFVQFAACEAGVEDFGIDASGDSSKALRVEEADEFAGVALPDGEEGGHAHAGKVFFAIGAQVFQEDIAEGTLSNALFEMHEQGFLHACLVNGIDALRRDANFVEGHTDGLGLLEQEFAADAVHADALVTFGHRGQQRRHANIFPMEQRKQRHGAVFAAPPADEDGFGVVHRC